MIKPMDVTPEVFEALASLRTYAKRYPTMGLSAALNVLDDAGVFAEIDEANDYASAEEILAESAAISMVGQSNPNIPAHKALQVLHDTWHPERAETVGQYARRISGGEHEHIFNSPHSDEVCYADPNCGVTYRQFVAERRTESTYEQLPDNFLDLVEELSRPVVGDGGTVVPPAL